MASGVEAVHRDAMHQPGWFSPAKPRRGLHSVPVGAKRVPLARSTLGEALYLTQLSTRART